MTTNNSTLNLVYFFGSCRLISPSVKAVRKLPADTLYANRNHLFYTHYLEEAAQKFRLIHSEDGLSQIQSKYSDLIDCNQKHSSPYSAFLPTVSVCQTPMFKEFLESLCDDASGICLVTVFNEISTNRRLKCEQNDKFEHWCHLTHKSTIEKNDACQYTEDFAPEGDYHARIKSFEDEVLSIIFENTPKEAHPKLFFNFIYQTNIPYTPANGQAPGFWNKSRFSLWLDTAKACKILSQDESLNVKRYCMNIPKIVLDFSPSSVILDLNHFSEPGSDHVGIAIKDVFSYIQGVHHSVPAPNPVSPSKPVYLLDPRSDSFNLDVIDTCKIIFGHNSSLLQRYLSLGDSSNAELKADHTRLAAANKVLVDRVSSLSSRIVILQKERSEQNANINRLTKELSKSLSDTPSSTSSSPHKHPISYVDFVSSADLKLIQSIINRRLTYLSRGRLSKLLATIRKIEDNKIPGIVIEAGCALGGSAALVISALNHTRAVRLYDIFGMIPEPSPMDPSECHERYRTIISGLSQGLGDDLYYGYVENLLEVTKRNILSIAGHDKCKSVDFIVGDLRSTLSIQEPVAFAHIDVDWFESVDCSIRRIAPNLSIGGGMLIDDFSDWGGCTKAVMRFINENASRYVFDTLDGSLLMTKVAADRDAATSDKAAAQQSAADLKQQLAAQAETLQQAQHARDEQAAKLQRLQTKLTKLKRQRHDILDSLRKLRQLTALQPEPPSI